MPTVAIGMGSFLCASECLCRHASTFIAGTLRFCAAAVGRCVVGLPCPQKTPTPDGNVIWNTLPEFIFVRFETRTRWRIPGIEEDNVFPVSVQSKPWFLDAGRVNPKLKITRYQFPLAPDFADTFHGAQGSTAEPGIIADLYGVDPIAGYIGMTRSRTRQKVLIYRPFPLAPFQVGLPLGRQLLLDVWRQEPVDWDALRKKYLDERPCQECREMKRKDAFTKAQWKQDTYRVCKECTAQKREAGTPYRCTQCGLWHAACHFATKHQNPRWSLYRVCLTCNATRQCFSCMRKLTEEYFTASAWKTSKPNRRLCIACQQKCRGRWTCAQCCRKLPVLHFSHYSALRPGAGQNGRQTCDACRAIAVQATVRKRAAQRTAQRVQPLRKKLRVQQTLRETWEAIAACVSARQQQTAMAQSSLADVGLKIQKRHDGRPTTAKAVEAKAGAAHSSTQALAVGSDNATPRRYTYICPHCAKSVQSTVVTGEVDHRRSDGCGKRFRVANGLLAGRTHPHTCPTCGAVVRSTKASGRIQITHRTPSGRQCRTNHWHVHS